MGVSYVYVTPTGSAPNSTVVLLAPSTRIDSLKHLLEFPHLGQSLVDGLQVLAHGGLNGLLPGTL